jgi:MFS family permease
MKKNQVHPRVYFVSLFAFLYTFTRQTFLPCADSINIPGLLDSSNLFSIVNITSAFGFIYACLQIPYGITIDLIGINRMVTILTGIMTTGLLICTLSTTDFMFALGRIITVFGCGGAFISAVKTQNYELGQAKTSQVMGILVSVSLSFGIFFIKYLVPSMNQIQNGWRYLYGIKTMVLALVFLYFFNLQKKKIIKEEQTEKELISFKECIISMKNNPRMLLLVAFAFVFFMIFYSVNETPFMANYLELTLGIIKQNTYSILLMGFLFGFLTTPFAVSFLGNLTFCYTANILLMILSVIMLKFPSLYIAYIFLFLVGYSNGLQMVILGLASLEIEKKYMGMLIGIFNGLFLAGSILPQQFFIHTIKNIMDTRSMFVFIIGISIVSSFIMKLYNNLKK